jgi:hypothetical protein
MWSLALWFLAGAIWGLFLLIVAIFNPRNLVAKLYDLGNRTSHVGRVRLGYVPTIADPTLRRIFMGLGGAFLFGVGATAFALVIAST